MATTKTRMTAIGSAARDSSAEEVCVLARKPRNRET